ncbi:MAG TPA: branched-chain amino acid ABC transporter substrate-binding protein [Candidatus Eremiobacteraceae bacterium]|nr:branched-chain amino acid ABC transporter substrate-binding protein [Candidatus Eremiobacteraceae bacterium]
MLRTVMKHRPRVSNHFTILAILICAALAGASESGCNTAQSSTPASTGTITIGVDLPLSGADASDGVPTANGVQLAVRDANDAGLVSGFVLRVDVRDDAVNGVHDPGKGAANFFSFVADPDDLGVIGPLNSNVAEAEIPISDEDRLALISPSNTNPALTTGAEAMRLRRVNPLLLTYFRVSTTDEFQGAAGAAFARREIGAHRAFVVDDGETFGRGIADEWASEFRSEGGTVLDHLHALRGRTDYRALAGEIEGVHPDIVFFGGDSSTGAADARAAMDGTPLAAVPYESGDGILNQQFLDVAGSQAEGTYATVAAVDAARLPTAQEFVSEYRAAFDREPGDYSANAYAATMVLVQAISRAVAATGGKMPSRDDVLEQLRSDTAYPSILGMLSFDANGDTRLKIVSIWEVVKHRWSFVMQRDFSHTKNVL